MRYSIAKTTLAGLLVLGLMLVPNATPPTARSAPTDPDYPVAPAHPSPSADAYVIVDITGVPVSEAQRLADALPEMDEAINAGTEQVTLPLWRVDVLRDQGFPVRVVRQAPTVPAGWLRCYSTIDQIYAWVDSFTAAHPDLLEVIDIGDSFCKERGRCTTPGNDTLKGRDILVVRVTREGATSPKEGRLWIDGGIHARELPTVELVKTFIMHLVDGYDSDPQITYLLDHRELYVGVIVNPDGRDLVELGTRRPYDSSPWYWRKNANDTRRSDMCVWPPLPDNHYGVDLNRNHGFKWGEPGYSNNPCAQTYHGTTPASEPETKAWEAFLRSIFPDQRGPADADPAPSDTTGMMINFHNVTLPGKVLVPWGWSRSPSPNDADLFAIARRYGAGNGYESQYALYPASGETRDWAYGELGIPSYVIELAGVAFFTVCRNLPGVIQENIDPLVMSLGISDRPYERIKGPEVPVIDAPRTVEAGDVVRITAQLDERRAGGNAVAGAEVTIGRPGGPTGAEGHPAPGVPPGAGLVMSPADGRFDAVMELAVLDLDTTGMAAGRHYIAVRGRDAVGHWGPIATAPVDVTIPDPVLGLSASAPAQVTAGDVLTYTLHVTVARAAAAAVTLTARVPDGGAFRAASHGGRESGGTVVWSLGDRPVGALNVTLAVDVDLVPTERTITLSDFSVRYSGGGEAVGPSVHTRAIPLPELSVTKTGPGRARAGSALTYTLTVHVSTGPAQGVVVTDRLPAGTTFLAASQGGAPDDGAVTWVLGDLAVGAAVSVTVTVFVEPTPTGRFVINADYAVGHSRGSGERGPPVVTLVRPTSTTYLPVAMAGL